MKINSSSALNTAVETTLVIPGYRPVEQLYVGSRTLVANQLNVRNDGQISVSNTGGGSAGNLLVNADVLKQPG